MNFDKKNETLNKLKGSIFQEEGIIFCLTSFDLDYMSKKFNISFI